MMLQKGPPDANSWPNSVAVPPTAPVIGNCGNRAAIATPTWAFALCSSDSAARTSGR
jgi:hypothetical protein